MRDLPFLAGEHGRGPFLVILFFVSATVVTMWGIWEGTLPRSEEAVLVETAREILVTGNGWTMHFDGEPVHDIPPISMWAMALSFRILGSSEFAARLPFVIFTVLTFYLVYLSGMVAGGERGSTEIWITRSRAVGLLSAIVLASSPLFGRFATHITHGMPFAFFVSLSILAWLRLPHGRGGLFLWGVGIAGGILSTGAGGLLVIPGMLLAVIADRERRALFRKPSFIFVTLIGLFVGCFWLVWTTQQGGFSGSSLWTVFSRMFRRGAGYGLLRSIKQIWLGNLPWSIPATAALVRIIFFRGDHRQAHGITEVDYLLLAFSAAIFVPVAMTSSNTPSALVPVLPLGALLSAREIARWTTGSSEEVSALRIWCFNQALTAIFCLLMLLLVATPLRLHRVAIDPITDIARMAGQVVPEGKRIGNFRQRQRTQGARLLFYGQRSLAAARTEPLEVVQAFEQDPDIIFLSTNQDLDELRNSGHFPSGLRVVYRAGDLVLFSLEETERIP